MTALAAKGHRLIVLVRKREIGRFRASVEHATEAYRPHHIEQAFPHLSRATGAFGET